MMNKAKTKEAKEAVEAVVEMPTVIEEGVKKYIRASSYHWVVRTEKGEAYCCREVKVDDFLHRHSSNITKAEGDTKVRRWVVITTAKIEMVDVIPYVKNASWGEKEPELMTSLLNLEEDEESEEEEEND